ncbi:hypothetical protein [Fusobacterium sp. PH5-44]|uniref:tetratricopeptide repeat protein n=1 Tax=unclassified Fusobacterium TaxID=2648384 RepID=UPI003D1D4D0D
MVQDTATTEEELKNMLEKLNKNPQDLDLINNIALVYFENPSLIRDKEDLKYFQLAYDTKKTVKSTHNFAWYLYFEMWEKEKAMQISEECLNMKPKSFYPYSLYGFMLMENGDYEKAINYLKIANEKEESYRVMHNLGCCYLKIGNYQLAKEHFHILCNKFVAENKSKFNLAIAEFTLNKPEITKKVADELYETIAKDEFENIDAYEISFIYFLLENYGMAVNSMLKQGINEIDFLDWEHLSYSFYKVNIEIWKKQLQIMIDARLETIKEIENNDDSWEFDTEDEKSEYILKLAKEIDLLKDMLKNGAEKPVIDINKNIIIETCGCLLFDCKRHGNLFDDENYK